MARLSGGQTMAARKRGTRAAGQVVQRILAAVFGGYVLTLALAIVAVDLLPMPPFDAVMTMLMLSFILYPGVILWVFAVRSLATLWLGLLLAATLLGSALLVLRWSSVA